MFKSLGKKYRWKNEMKFVDKHSHEYILGTLCQSLQDLLEDFFDYMYSTEIERVCFELIETIANLKSMIQTEDLEEYEMLKHRVMYMLQHRMESWYI